MTPNRKDIIFYLLTGIVLFSLLYTIIGHMG